MRNLTLTSTAFVLVTSQVFGAPPAAPAAVSAKPPLVVTRATDTEVVRAKAHTFRPATLVDATSEDRKEGPSLFPVRVARPVPVKPHLNVAKFGESMHAALKDKVRGYALGLRKNGQPILTLQWDWSRSPSQGSKGWNLDTKEHIASVSKLITAIAAVKMLDERNLSFDTKIGNYIPAYWNEGKNANDLTFRKLLTHQAAFTVYGGDFLSFKQQIEMGVSSNPADGIGYTNGSFSLIRVLAATMTGAVPRNKTWAFPGLAPSLNANLNNAMWDASSTEAFLTYVQNKVFTPSGVSGVSPKSNDGSALAYSGKNDGQGWDSGDVTSQVGGAGFRMSVNQVLDVMGTFRRKGTIVSPAKAQEALDARLGIDQVIDTPLGKIYNKNGRWQNGSGPNDDAEQSVAYFLQEDMEVVLLVNSWIGAEQASVRGSVKDAYLANIE